MLRRRPSVPHCSDFLALSPLTLVLTSEATDSLCETRAVCVQHRRGPNGHEGFVTVARRNMHRLAFRPVRDVPD
jgi:hypothetical protein